MVLRLVYFFGFSVGRSVFFAKQTALSVTTILTLAQLSVRTPKKPIVLSQISPLAFSGYSDLLEFLFSTSMIQSFPFTLSGKRYVNAMGKQCICFSHSNHSPLTPAA